MATTQFTNRRKDNSSNTAHSDKFSFTRSVPTREKKQPTKALQPTPSESQSFYQNPCDS
jgi:hypothetical protein